MVCAGLSEQSSDHSELDFEKQIKDINHHKKKSKEYKIEGLLIVLSG